MTTKRVTYSLDIGEIVPQFTLLDPKHKKEIKALIAESVIDDIHKYLDGSNSPVSGGKFKSFKADKSPSQLLDHGDMRSAIDWKDGKKDNVEIGIWDKDETPKAFNHNTGDTLPMRKFIPLEDEKFKQPIINKIKRLVLDEI